eukprot:NODE_10822_length_1326_cov_6.930776.p2 GENE.NODE_10822_length_1326_cov_6.930776~~NODE_10822_length_1326_cov_6.930776.p2  ORF type:complete len:341 (-),score=94.35 NODE_10822_length_1326_cov_6.930776:255-1277(-)
MPVHGDIASELSGTWQVGLFEAPCKAPLSCCYGTGCMSCSAYQQRKRILKVISEPYVPCGGVCPCGPLGQPQNECFLFPEVCCCPGLAVAANRFYVQTRFDRRNTACDDCILWTTCIASWFICLASLCETDLPQELENAVDCLVLSVNGCMYAQQQVEIKHIEATGFAGAPPRIANMLNPVQQQMIQMGKPMPQGAVAPQQVQMGQPPQAYGAQQAYGAPPPQQQMQPGRGFMATASPQGVSWQEYCSRTPAFVDGAGNINQPWAECIAWAKVFEAKTPNWRSMPDYQMQEPSQQVIAACVTSAPNQFQANVMASAQRFEQMCNNAISTGQPLPVIGQRI